jgi:hypothetical protein
VLLLRNTDAVLEACSHCTHFVCAAAHPYNAKQFGLLVPSVYGILSPLNL